MKLAKNSFSSGMPNVPVQCGIFVRMWTMWTYDVHLRILQVCFISVFNIEILLQVDTLPCSPSLVDNLTSKQRVSFSIRYVQGWAKEWSLGLQFFSSSMFKLRTTLGKFGEFWALIADFWLAWMRRNQFVNTNFSKLRHWSHYGVKSINFTP